MEALQAIAEGHERIDHLEAAMLDQGDLIEFEWTHTFTPNLYIREIFMPAGSLTTTKVHNTEHPFVVMEGLTTVYSPEGETVTYQAGDKGITMPGTRRVLYIHEDCVWITFHALNAEEEALRVSGADEKELLDMIEARIIQRRELPSGDTMYELYQKKLDSVKLEGV